MATLYVTEYSSLAWVGRTPTQLMQAPGSPAAAQQTVAIGGSSAQSAEFGTTTTLIRVHTDAICSIAIGPNPTAAATAQRMAAGATEYFGVQTGDKIAVITNS